MNRLLVLASVALVMLMAAAAQAADDPTGTWKWTVKFNDMEREVTLKLKLEGDKLTGSMPGRNNQETAIENGTYKDGQISFSVTRTRGDNKITSKYTGKVEGEKITGKIETERGGQTNSRDWAATKVKE